ncbi:hypothetical protein [Moraxella lacunata]
MEMGYGCIRKTPNPNLIINQFFVKLSRKNYPFLWTYFYDKIRNFNE